MRKCNFLPGICLAAVLSAVIPLQSYLGNGGLFVFTPVRLAVELLILFAAFGLVLSALTAVEQGLARVFGWQQMAFVPAVLSALLVCLYLETGILSAGLPEINGDYMPELAVLSRGVLDGAVWVVIILGFLIAARFKGFVSALPIISGAVLILGLASLFDVAKSSVSSGEEGRLATGRDSSGGCFAWQYDIINNVRYSDSRNVLVFILDSMPGNLSGEMIRKQPELAKMFTGFTAYTNNVAMHDCTKLGLPGLMTGIYYDPQDRYTSSYPMSMYGDDSVLTQYVKDGADVAFSPDLLPYGLTTLPIVRKTPQTGKQKHGWAALLLRTKEVPYLSLFDLVVFRICPYLFKGPFVYAKIRHDPMFEKSDFIFWHEHVMYPILASSPIRQTQRPLLGVFHSWGAHPPAKFDKDGRAYESFKIGDEAVFPSVYNPLYKLGRLLDVYRERKLYDKSAIILCADHGVPFAPLMGPGRHTNESTILWYKPENAGPPPIGCSPEKTSSSKVAPLLRELLTGPVDASRAAGILKTDHCRFYSYNSKKYFGDDTEN